MAKTKYIFVTGGVTSSLGKGIISASLATLLQGRGFRVTCQKFDPYLNVDPGTLNPYEHGECYVTDDGAETDLDLGHYERFLNIRTSQANNVTTGRLYFNVITKEREGAFLGKTVQVIPHITDEIKRNFYAVSANDEYDIVITEIGGCVGDIESLPFIEAVRQARWELGAGNACIIHLTLVPYLKSAGELKTKPTQHSVRTLSEAGVQPDILVCRTEHSIPQEMRNKIAQFCNVATECVIESIDAESIYQVPLLMRKEKLDQMALNTLHLWPKQELNLDQWEEFLEKLTNPKRTVNIALVGKYVDLHDAYKSIVESFTHAGAVTETQVNIHWTHAEDLVDQAPEQVLAGVDGILVAPGFGERGIEGKINAVRYARESNIPFFGICLGMQCAVVEFARNVIGWKEAASTEMNPATSHPVIDMMEEQKKITAKGGTMRLGAYDCQLEKGSLAADVYGQGMISERHRHRFEFNGQFEQDFINAGMRLSGRNPKTGLVEVIEIPSHPYFIGSQYHPELKSTVLQPHPLFVGFVKAANTYAAQKQQAELAAV